MKDFRHNSAVIRREPYRREWREQELALD